MEFLSDPQFWWKWTSIVLIELVLAGDNALVIVGLLLSLPLAVWGSGVLAPIVSACGTAPMGWWFARGTVRAKGEAEPA